MNQPGMIVYNLYKINWLYHCIMCQKHNMIQLKDVTVV